MDDRDNNILPEEGDEEAYEQSPEDRERSQRLFEKLAAEEPPLDLDNDTAPSKTAPREAVVIAPQDTRPVTAVEDSGIGRYALTVGVGMLLTISLVITIIFFVQSDGDDDPSDNEAVVDTVPTNTDTPQDTTTPPTRVPTATLNPTATVIPTSEVIEQFLVELPPTAAVDELSVALLTPIPQDGNVSFGSGGEIVREDSAFTIAGQAARLDVTTYTIQQGDTLSGIADEFNLDLCTIIWSNARNKVAPLRPGAVIDIMPVDGVLYKVEKRMTIQQVAEELNVAALDIIDSPYNDLFGALPDTLVVEGMKLIVPSGERSDCAIWSPPVASGDGSGAVGGNVYGSKTLFGCSYEVSSASYPSLNPVGGSYTFFQGYSGVHSGVDLAASVGTSVLASGAGTVAFAGWNDFGYGNAIVIDHGGFYSLYAHLSSLNVSCGQVVNAGDFIGGVGSTGRSSGPHLHFEIRNADFNPIDPTYSIPL